MIMEGVHVVPGFIDRSQWRDALVLEFVVAVTDADSHRRHFAVREWETGGIRPLRRYLDSFAKIRRIQKYILAQATANEVPVIDNVSIDETVKQVMAMILQRGRPAHEGARPAELASAQVRAASHRYRMHPHPRTRRR